MRRFSIALIVTLAFGQQGLAHTVNGGENCLKIIETIGALEISADTVIEETADSCRIFDGHIKIDATVRYSFEELSVDGEGVIAALSEKSLPSSLNISAKNLHIQPVIDDKVFSYLLELQSPPFDVSFSIIWDESSASLRLVDASLSSQYIGRLALSGAFSNVSQPVASLFDTNPGPRIDSIRIVLEDRGLVGAFLVMPMSSFLEQARDPAAGVAAYQQTARDMIAGLPKAVADEGTKDVLTQFVDEFPRPSGIYEFVLTAGDGFSLEDVDVLPFMLEDRLTIEADYTETDLSLRSLEISN